MKLNLKLLIFDLNNYSFKKDPIMRTVNEVSLKYTASNIEKVQINNSTDAVSFLRQFFQDDMNIYESMFIALLNRSNKVTGYAKISQGGTAGTIVDTKLICKYAIESLSHGVILCHNHPSGNLTPSSSDISSTKKVKAALDLFDCKLLDHIILTPSGFLSFQADGLI